MFEVIIVSHGSLARSLFETAQLIAGEREGVKTFGLELGDSVDLFAAQVTSAIEESLARGDVLVLTDLQSGSPFNVTVGAMTEWQFRHITGVNLPLVIETLGIRDFMSLDEAFDELLAVGQSSVIDAGAYLNALEEGGART